MTMREIYIGIGGAVGGALLATAGDIATEYYKNRVEEERRVVEKAARRQEDTAKQLETLAASFDDLGPVAWRAAEFAETGKEGKVDDVRVVASHFDRIIRLITNKTATPEQVGSYYRTRLRGWATRFKDLGEGTSPVSARFTSRDRHNFRLMAPALSQILAAAEPVEDWSNGGEVGQYATESNLVVMETDADNSR